MEQHNDGGSAFPLHYATMTGMTLRDYFAAKALQGLLGDDVNDSPTRFAESAYALADAMIAAREK